MLYLKRENQAQAQLNQFLASDAGLWDSTDSSGTVPGLRAMINRWRFGACPCSAASLHAGGGYYLHTACSKAKSSTCPSCELPSVNSLLETPQKKKHVLIDAHQHRRVQTQHLETLSRAAMGLPANAAMDTLTKQTSRSAASNPVCGGDGRWC
jgi:hypothetical protein